MIRFNGIKYLAFLSFFFLSVTATNFTQCLIDFKRGDATEGGTDYYGNPVVARDAVALTYRACTDWCGKGSEPFNWSVFSQQFSAWLLPWLALTSQLPFGAETRLDNFISVALTVGSPTLAAFSLALTAVNTRWAYDRFSAIKYPNSRNAAKALVYLQQLPLRLTIREGLLASLIVLPENDDWWECLVDRLEQTHTWTTAAATSITWVIIAFVFAIVDSLMNMGHNVNSNGQGVGSLWLWLIPIVVGSLWIPVCSYKKLKAAIDKANGLAFVAARNSPSRGRANRSPKTDIPKRVCNVSHMQAIRVYKRGKVFTKDAARASPVFNYSRLWEWSSVVETIARGFEQANRKVKRHTPVDAQKEWVYSEEKRPTNRRENGAGTVTQVQAYCGFPDQGYAEPTQSPPGIWKRIFIASVFALGLQWGTTGSAAIVVVSTPTAGFGCRSASYVLYGVVSTIIWLTLLLSGYLAHCAKVRHDTGLAAGARSNSALVGALATSLRRLSILAACCNALYVILVCVFQFSNFYSTCYCNSSVLGRGSRRAYNIIATGYNYDHVETVWIGGAILVGGCVFLFLFFLHLILEPYLGTHEC